MAATTCISSASETARVTSRPMRPAAPQMATLIMFRSPSKGFILFYPHSLAPQKMLYGLSKIVGILRKKLGAHLIGFIAPVDAQIHRAGVAVAPMLLDGVAHESQRFWACRVETHHNTAGLASGAHHAFGERGDLFG